MDLSPDFRDLFRLLNKHRVKYLVVGAHAVVYYTEPRFTKDLDILIKSDLQNAERVYQALREFGAPLKGMAVKDLTDRKMVYQIGVAPVRVDIIMGLPGMDFDSIWKNRVRSKYGDVPISILGKNDLMHAKKRAGRPQDKIDLEKLQHWRKQ